MYKQYLSFHLDFHQNRFYRPNPYIHEHHQPWPTEVTSPRRYQSEVAMLTHGGGARFAFLFPRLWGMVCPSRCRTLCATYAGGLYHRFLLLSTRYPGCKARKTHPPPEHNVCVWSLGRADKRERENARPVAFIIPGHVPE